MSYRNKGMDVVARTARLHPAEPHCVPYLKRRVKCRCGGFPQPWSSADFSKAKRMMKKYSKDPDEQMRKEYVRDMNKAFGGKK